MRISDWSSDVCSSDLVETGEIIAENDVGVFHRRHRHRRAARPAEGVGVGPHTHHARRADVDMLAEVEADIAADQVRPALDVVGAELVEIIAGAPEEADFGAFVPHAVLAALAERSEEHTSELQSLMRISYAVFCLTKKKYKHDNKQNITNNC